MKTHAIQEYVNMNHPGRCQIIAKIMGDSRCLSNPILIAQEKFKNLQKESLYGIFFNEWWLSEKDIERDRVNFEREKELIEPLFCYVYSSIFRICI